IRSFIIPKDQVEIIADWQAMGMKATGTYSFKVHNILVDEAYSFIYNEFYTDAVLDRIPFRIFADLTLLVNYAGMAEHFIKEAENYCFNDNNFCVDKAYIFFYNDFYTGAFLKQFPFGFFEDLTLWKNYEGRDKFLKKETKKISPNLVLPVFKKKPQDTENKI